MPRLFFLLLFALLVAARLCHVEILWAEETLPLAAAQQMRAGKVLYRDIWFDKPPFAPVLYAALGGEAGWRLRLGGAAHSPPRWRVAGGVARGGVAVAAGRRALCPALLRDRVGLRARSVGPARRAMGGRAARLLSDLRLSFLGDSSGGGSVDAGSARGGGVAGVPAASAVGGGAGGSGICDQPERTAGAGGVRVVGAVMDLAGGVCGSNGGGLGLDVECRGAGRLLGRGLALGAGLRGHDVRGCASQERVAAHAELGGFSCGHRDRGGDCVEG